jgi:hypothetical protein
LDQAAIARFDEANGYGDWDDDERNAGESGRGPSEDSALDESGNEPALDYADGEYLRSHQLAQDNGPDAAEGDDQAEDVEAGPGALRVASWMDAGEDETSRPAFDDRLTQELEQSLRQPSLHARDKEMAEDGLDEGMSAQELASSLWQRPQLPLNEIDAIAHTSEDADDLGSPDRQMEDSLVREIEARHERRAGAERENSRGGGLVLVAAWGLFLCFISGLGVSFISFRDMIANELPGTARLYRSIGWPITVQPLTFENVGYKWAVSEAGKPMIVVTGSLVNRAQRKMPVPILYVGVRDRDKTADREFKTLIQTGKSKMRPEEHANFTIELLSPKPTVRAVELEIRNVR